MSADVIRTTVMLPRAPLALPTVPVLRMCDSRASLFFGTTPARMLASTSRPRGYERVRSWIRHWHDGIQTSCTNVAARQRQRNADIANRFEAVALYARED